MKGVQSASGAGGLRIFGVRLELGVVGGTRRQAACQPREMSVTGAGTNVMKALRVSARPDHARQ